MRTGRTYQPVDSAFPLRGLNLVQPSVQGDLRTFTEVENVESVKGVMEKRSGYHTLGTQLQSPSSENETDPVIGLIRFETLAGTDFLVVCTTKRQYYYNAAGGTFTDITVLGTARVIVTVNTGLDWVEIAGDHTTEHVVGGHVKISGSTGNDGSYKITSSTFTGGNTRLQFESGDITDGMVDGTVEGYTLWTGDETNTLDFAIGVGSYGGTTTRYLFITNGKDLPRVWDGTGTFTVLSLSAGLSGLVSVGTLSVFKDHLVFGNIATATSQPQTIAWSDTAEFDDFGGGNSATQLLPDSMGTIRRVLPLGDRLMIYSDESIGAVTFVGSAAIFSFEQLVQSTRLLSGRAIANLGPFHLFASQENIMLFEGTRMFRPAGDEIHPRYREVVSLTDSSQAFAWHDRVREEVAFVVPTSSSESTVYRAEYNIFNIRDLRWSEHTYANRPQSFGFFVRDATLKWNSTALSGKGWDEVSGQWNDSSIRQDYPDRVLGSSGFVYTDDGTDFDDGATAVDARLTTVDFTVPRDHLSIKGRWVKVEVEMRGVKVDVAWSGNRGQSFTTVTTGQTLTGNWTRYSFYMDHVSETFRVRLHSPYADSSFSVRWIRAWFKPESTQ